MNSTVIAETIPANASLYVILVDSSRTQISYWLNIKKYHTFLSCTIIVISLKTSLIQCLPIYYYIQYYPEYRYDLHSVRDAMFFGPLWHLIIVMRVL